MSEKRTKTVIGAFVVGAIALIVVGVVAFGSGQMFLKKQSYLQYFDESVKGLTVGAPVMFRGVKIGTVVAIKLEGDFDQLRFAVPVVTEINTDAFPFAGVGIHAAEAHQALLGKGLCAQLQIQSFLTGQLMINLDFIPDRPTQLNPNCPPKCLQIPTITSPSQELAQKLDSLSIKTLMDNATTMLDNFNRLVTNTAWPDLAVELTSLVDDTRKAVTTLEREAEQSFAQLRQTLTATADAAAALERTLAFEQGPSADLLREATDMVTEAKRVLASLDQAVQTADARLRDDRPLAEMREAFRDVGSAAQAVRLLADTLERHPEAILRGKSGQKEHVK